MNKQLTAKGRATRQRIIVAAALLIREKGAAETTLDDVRAATATSKSQLFHYFPEGRSDILAAVAEYEAEQVLEAQRPYLDDLSTWESWQGWRQAVLDHYTELGQKCPLGSLTAELGKSSPRARVIVSSLYADWEAALVRGVAAVAPEGEEMVRRRAQSILAAVQGGVVMLQGTGRTDYLAVAVAEAIDPLRRVRTDAARA
ncbi:TetR/AcrR family transcriptional regulator [Streptomyces olivaceoviridis]|uniref:TetR/AcrR family transcriptional regulator n=1 Tax=Streptomyces olivaceoviridis TaxID=1921 RepID=UPI0036FB3B6D